jgi:hypothetical protein
MVMGVHDGAWGKGEFGVVRWFCGVTLVDCTALPDIINSCRIDR